MELKRHKDRKYLELLSSLLSYESRILKETMWEIKKELSGRVRYYYAKEGVREDG